MSARERAFVPPAHDLVHVLKLPHMPTTQSTGHAVVKQSTTSSVTGQILPPCATGVVMVLERDFAPPPHVFVQLE